MDNNQQQQEHLPNVIVIGGGMVGLATALGLANTGKFQVHVVELRPNFDRMGSTFTLAPNGAKALEELDPDGIIPIVHEIGIDASQSFASGGRMLSWGMLRNALLERVRSKPNLVRFHMGYTLKDIVDDPKEGHVQATFVPSSSRNKEQATTTDDYDQGTCESDVLTLQGCLIVGVDGVHSSVRTYLNCQPAKSTGWTVWRGSVVVDPENPRTLDRESHEMVVGLLNSGIMPLGRPQKFGPTAWSIFNFHSKSPGRMNWAISSLMTDVPPKSHPWNVAMEPYVENDSTDATIIQAIFSLSDKEDLLNPIDLCVVELPPQQDQDDGETMECGWGGKGRVMLIGDAAHAMRPSTGQGGSMGFEDAVVLCRALRDVVLDENDGAITNNYDAMFDRVVQRVENARIDRVRKIWEVAKIMAERGYGMPPDENPVTPEYLQWLVEGV